MKNQTIQNNYILQDNDFILDNEDRRYILRVKDLEEDDKPREKLIKNGPSALSSVELLAIVLSVGTKKEEVLRMSSRILKEYGEKTIVNQTNPKIIEKELGIPIAKSCQIVACFELGRRFFKKTPAGTIVVRTARQAYEYLKDMRGLPKEHLRGIYLNSRYRVIHDEVISVGSLTANIVHPREVFKPALEHSACAVILAHNHPSGSAKPTVSDVEITKQLVEAGKILGIDLLDHIVIAKNKFVSVPIDYE
ncbi:DNA repair protein RadC [Candidatus Parcubacteria bacterium]|nr:DNA repair protein RadC [Patescibacteria group bacterium]MCG2693985.1 DNA repair protein RadC [Candidatus Parcubacteria bacterium]